MALVNNPTNLSNTMKKLSFSVPPNLSRYSGIIAIVLIAVLASCGKPKSAVTGWNYNDPKNGGFEVVPYDEQETGPGLVGILHNNNFVSEM